MDALVELSKDDYLVASLPEHGSALGFAALSDFNLRPDDARRAFAPGQRLSATVAALPSEETGARIFIPTWRGLRSEHVVILYPFRRPSTSPQHQMLQGHTTVCS